MGRGNAHGQGCCDADGCDKAPHGSGDGVAAEYLMPAQRGLVGSRHIMGFHTETGHDGGHGGNQEHQRLRHNHRGVLVDGPSQRHEHRMVHREASRLQNLGKTSEVLNQQNHHHGRDGHGERPAHGSGAHRAEDGGHNNGHGHAKQETKSAQQHGRSECGLPWFHPDGELQNHVRQRVEQGECDVDGGHGVSDVHEHLVLLPIGGDAACEHHHDDGQDVGNDRAPQHRVVDERALIDHGRGAQAGEYDGGDQTDDQADETPMRAYRLISPLADREHHAQAHHQQCGGQSARHHCHELFKHSRPFSVHLRLPSLRGAVREAD